MMNRLLALRATELAMKAMREDAIASTMQTLQEKRESAWAEIQEYFRAYESLGEFEFEIPFNLFDGKETRYNDLVVIKQKETYRRGEGRRTVFYVRIGSVSVLDDYYNGELWNHLIENWNKVKSLIETRVETILLSRMENQMRAMEAYNTSFQAVTDFSV